MKRTGIAAALLALVLLASPPQTMAEETNSQIVSKDRAIRLANKLMPGAIVGSDTRVENGQTYYDLVIMTKGGNLYQVTVNASTGKVSKPRPYSFGK